MREGWVGEIISQVSCGRPQVSPLDCGVGGIVAPTHFPGSEGCSMAVGATHLSFSSSHLRPPRSL